MDIKGRNMGNWDNMYTYNDATGELARNKENDIETELTANQFNRIFHAIITKIKKLFKKS